MPGAVKTAAYWDGLIPQEVDGVEKTRFEHMIWVETDPDTIKSRSFQPKERPRGVTCLLDDYGAEQPAELTEYWIHQRRVCLSLEMKKIYVECFSRSPTLKQERASFSPLTSRRYRSMIFMKIRRRPQTVSVSTKAIEKKIDGRKKLGKRARKSARRRKQRKRSLKILPLLILDVLGESQLISARITKHLTMVWQQHRKNIAQLWHQWSLVLSSQMVWRKRSSELLSSQMVWRKRSSELVSVTDLSTLTNHTPSSMTMQCLKNLRDLFILVASASSARLVTNGPA
jgi:hypothetical protein